MPRLAHNKCQQYHRLCHYRFYPFFPLRLTARGWCTSQIITSASSLLKTKIAHEPLQHWHVCHYVSCHNTHHSKTVERATVLILCVHHFNYSQKFGGNYQIPGFTTPVARFMEIQVKKLCTTHVEGKRWALFGHDLYLTFHHTILEPDTNTDVYWGWS